MLTLAAFVFVIGVLITIHEAGHFAMARLLGAPVEVFSIGFGKRLWGFEHGGTDYRISLVPLGGYVRIIGLGPDESDVVGDGARTSSSCRAGNEPSSCSPDHSPISSQRWFSSPSLL